MFLPSYTALKPCALTAKSVVNHKANMDPLLTMGEGSINPDNLENKHTEKKCIIKKNLFKCVSPVKRKLRISIKRITVK